jgi:hypothetical protein
MKKARDFFFSGKNCGTYGGKILAVKSGSQWWKALIT